MILTIDAGNSNIVAGVFIGSELNCVWRLATDADRMQDEWWAILQPLSSADNIDLTQVTSAVISSVVPRLTPKLVELVRERIGVEPIIISSKLDIGIGVHTDNPFEVGADRIVNSLAVQHLYRAPAIVVDFGTATTFDVVSAEGNYIGGAIAPGVQLALDALTGRAARLSAIELAVPAQAIGSNTVKSVQSGTILGYVELVNGMLERIVTELDGDPVIIATGGLGKLFEQHCPRIVAWEPDLTLIGLRLIHELHSR
ncbi:MAG: type III pantothenate kinase [Sphaerobacteraceae bacterium]|nr:MAG: type III pantothenate kinase [Sphaerobacteraceae bacterium]